MISQFMKHHQNLNSLVAMQNEEREVEESVRKKL